jgi:metal-dependent amidase/aminoacylase/carboxypeptidase family protein
MPELGFEEVKTAAYVADKLAASGYKVRTGVGRTGVIADLGSPKVAIRAEMDGLALVDSSAALYRSHHPGLSHSCGHDVNMACVLAAARKRSPAYASSCNRPPKKLVTLRASAAPPALLHPAPCKVLQQ